NIQAGLARYPVYATFGGTLGFDQRFNRLQVSGGATVDRTVYQNSQLTDGEVTSNDDRNYNQYGGVSRVSYELKPGLKPFVEVEGDDRVHDLPVDRSGFQRDSTGSYVDPRLNRLDGLLTSGSLIWNVSGLTTAKFITDTQIAEVVVPNTSGVLVHTYAVE